MLACSLAPGRETSYLEECGAGRAEPGASERRAHNVLLNVFHCRGWDQGTR